MDLAEVQKENEVRLTEIWKNRKERQKRVNGDNSEVKSMKEQSFFVLASHILLSWR